MASIFSTWVKQGGQIGHTCKFSKNSIADPIISLEHVKSPQCHIYMLPKEVILTEIIRELPVNSIKKLAKTNCYFRLLCIDDNVWLHKVNILNNYDKTIKVRSPIYKYYQELVKWSWYNLLPSIEISNEGLTVMRTKKENLTNPVIRTRQSLTGENNWYRVKILQRGTWIGIGICNNNYIWRDGPTLGQQRKSINCAIFCQDSTLIQGYDGKNRCNDISLQQKLMVNDYITVIVDFKSNEVKYYQNDIYRGSVIFKNLLVNGPIYPCVNLSYDTKIQLSIKKENMGDM